MENIPITGHTQLTALLGSPVSHSISPLMHNESFRLLHLDYVYLCFDVTEQELEAVVSGLRLAGIRGFNLTMPNKNRIIELTDSLSPEVELIQTANTIVNDSGILTAYNTDGIGFMRSVKEAGHTIVGGTMTIIGAGGAASAICAQAALDGVEKIHIFARPTSRFWTRTEQLADRIRNSTNCSVSLHEHPNEQQLRASIAESTIFVNGTPVGMASNAKACIISDASYLHPELIVADLIYNPKETKLLAMAKSIGCPTLNGLPMLLCQGAEAFRLWTGEQMPVDRIQEKIIG